LTDPQFDTFDEKTAKAMLGSVTELGGLPNYLAIRHTELSAGRLVAEMDAREELLTPFGNLHGGCLSAFVDHCLGVVFYPVIPKGAWVATTEFKLNLIKPVSAGICQATTRVLAMAKRSGVARIDVVNNEQLVCAAQGTVTIVIPKA
jgi:1,4-dihydroxy-2-naphthoyl-CoA hydrolase